MTDGVRTTDLEEVSHMGSTLGASERDALKQQVDQLVEQAPFNLLTRQRLQELAAVESDGDPIVSLYLNLSPRKRLKRAWAVALKSMARDAIDQQPTTISAAAAGAEIEKIERMLDERIPDLERGVAVFSCEPIGLWWLVPVPLRIRNRLEIGRRPFLRPLVRILDEHDQYVVVLLDKRRARLFVGQHGSMFEVLDLFEDTPPHQKQGGWSQMRFQRQHDAHVLWHASAVGQATAMLVERFSAKHLLVSGTKEVLVEYKDQLPASAADRLEGTFTVAIDTPPKQIREAIRPLRAEIEAREEENIIREIQEAISSGRGVWDIEDTLRALVEQRVMKLVVADSFHLPGGECLHCGVITAQETGDCRGCGNPLAEVDDIVDVVLERALDQEADLELVRSPGALDLLSKAAPIGALLRY
jgi:peptide subunit release factor 1 (eRF1)